MIAALYIDPLGPYPKMAGVDCWDERRDARLYDGPHPVVAHPPCGPWGGLRHLCVPNRERRNDADCGPIAFDQVRKFGGVLEQPAGSLLSSRCGALPPSGIAEDRFGGRTIEVRQVEWGHPARKKTWLYLVGVPGLPELRLPPFPGRPPTHWVSGGRNPNRKPTGGVRPADVKVCSSRQRRRTPPLFAEWLISLARTVPLFGWGDPYAEVS